MEEIAGMTIAGIHPNIVQLVSTFEDHNDYHLVMELCPGGDLFEYLSGKGRIPEALAKEMIR